MEVRLYIPGTDDEIICDYYDKKEDFFLCKVKRLCCRGEILVLFHQLEEMVIGQVIPEVERLWEEIDRLGFVAQFPGNANTQTLFNIQLTNGDDIVFKVID
jgi:hypothetical protein